MGLTGVLLAMLCDMQLGGWPFWVLSCFPPFPTVAMLKKRLMLGLFWQRRSRSQLPHASDQAIVCPLKVLEMFASPYFPIIIIVLLLC